MFRLHHRTKPTKSGERVDFRFSHFKVVQVPKGWDKLLVSIICVETGKTMAKCGKETVRNGSCQWTETLSESIWVSHDDHSNVDSKEVEDCFLKFVVSMGSARSGILGEVVVNVASYMNSDAIVPVSFPLKKCNHGTILQVKIQCLTPKIKLRDGESKDIKSDKDEEIKSDSYDVELKSEESNITQTKNEEVSYSSADLDKTEHQKQNGKEASFSFSGSHQDYDSVEGSMEKESLSPPNNLSEETVQQESYPVHNLSQSNHSSFNSRITHSDVLSQDDPGEFVAPSFGLSGASKSLLEAAEDTIEELRKEAKTWERNARNLMLELEILRKEYLEQSKRKANMDMELSAACTERDSLQKEIEQLKELLEKSMLKPAASKDSALEVKSATDVIQELENEIKFQKESNVNLSLQLKRSQESNVELISVLQEMEETMEKQKFDIENLSSLQSKFDNMEKSVEENLEKNRNLMLEMDRLKESEKNLQSQVKELEEALEEKVQKIRKGNLRENVSVIEMDSYAGTRAVNGTDKDLLREIEQLKLKLEELESDCQELTEENLDLLLKLKETKSKSTGSDHQSELHDLEEKMKKKLLKEVEDDYNHSIQGYEKQKLELEAKIEELSKELSGKKAEIEELETGLLSKEEGIVSLQRYQEELEARLSTLQKDKEQLADNMKDIMRESDIATKCLNDLRQELTILSSTVDSHVSANKALERKCSELESSKRALELHLSEARQEKERLSARISGLEDQVSYLTDERESTRSELEKSKSHAEKLNEEITVMINEMEAQQTDLEQNLQEMHQQLSEYKKECEYLRRANPKLEATVEDLMEECSLVQKINGELQRQKRELQEKCERLEVKLTDSHRSFTECSMKVKLLEENISSILDDGASKVKDLTSEVDQLLKENDEQNKQLNLLNELYSEKTIEVDNLQQELKKISVQLSAANDDKERIASDVVKKVSGLHEVIDKLESELSNMQTEYKAKIQGLTDELASSKQDQEVLKADNGRMLKTLRNYRSCEEDFKTTLNGLELKITVSEYERQKMVEESTHLKAHLLQMEPLQGEVLKLKNELNATKSEKEKLETSIRLVSKECKQLKAEKSSLLERITDLQKAVSELQDCEQNAIALEKKLLKMESELVAKEALCQQDAELKNELSRVRRANKQLQGQIQQLEEEKDKCTQRAKSLEHEIILMKEKQNQKEESYKKGGDPTSKIQSLEDELSKARKENHSFKIQIKRLTSDNRKNYTGTPRRSTAEGEVVTKEKFERTKSSLETELRDIRERYFHMSLKYAEVEAQREELVMKLKAANNGKRWF